MKTAKYKLVRFAAVGIAMLGNLAFGDSLEVGNGASDNVYSDTAAYAAATKVVKSGTGITKLDLGDMTTKFKGEIEVKEGTLCVSSVPTSFGAPVKITVSSGATLDLSWTGNAAGKIPNAEIVISGNGVNGGGAIRRTSSDAINKLLGKIVLEGDAKIYLDQQVGFADSGFVKLNGHTLSKDGSAVFYCLNTPFYGEDGTTADPGNLNILKGTLFLRGSALQGGSAKNKIILADGVTLKFRSASAIAWAVDAAATATITSDDPSAPAVDKNRISGPVNAVSTLTLNPNAETTHISLADSSLNHSGLLVNGAGPVTFHNMAVTNKNNGDVIIKRTSPAVARLVLDGNTEMVGQTNGSGRAASQIIVGDEANNGSKIGALEIGGNSVVTNYGLSIGKNGTGAVYQRGGVSYWPITGPGYNRSANSSGAYAYLGITGGRFVYDADDGVADDDEKSSYFATIGSFIMASHGGFAEFVRSDKLGLVFKNGKFIYYQDGASTNCFDEGFGFGNSEELADNDYAGHGSVTVSGRDSKLQVNSYLRFLWANAEASGFVNLNNGGILAAKHLYRTSASTPVYLNFNGGVLQPLSSDQEFTYKNEAHRFPSAVTVYEKGCTIDTGSALNADGVQLPADDVIIRFPLQSPGEDGKRIASIALPSEVASKKLVGPPIVTISGDGYGASAFALFNDLTREVTNIVVTSPGWGYTQASATLSGGGLTQAYECDVTLSDQPAEGWKGFTKRGIVTLNMSGENTFKGDVTVEEGLLSFNNSTAAQSGMPVGAGVILKNGARISFRGELTAVSVPFIAGWGSTSYGRITVSDRIECAADDIFAGNHLRVGHDLILSDGVKIVITDPENLYKYHRAGKAVVLEAGVIGENRKLTCNSTPELVFGKECTTESVDRWKVRKSGNALTLDFMEGFVLSVR